MRAMRWGAAGTALLAVAFALDAFDVKVLTAIVSILGLVPALMGIPGLWGACAKATRWVAPCCWPGWCTSSPRPR